MKQKPQDEVSQSNPLARSAQSNRQNSQNKNRVLRSLSLRRVIIIPFVLEIFAIVAIVGYFSFKNSQESVKQLVTQLRNEVSSNIQYYLDDYLAVPQKINRLNATAIRLGQLNLNDSASLERHLWEQMRLFDRVSYIQFGTPQREFVGVQSSVLDSIKIEISGQATNYTLESYRTNIQGDRTQKIGSKSNYDPRIQPWYTTAVKAGKASWTEIDTYVNSPTLAITQVLPLYNEQNKSIGVTGVALALSEISNFLSSLDISENSQIFIVNRDNLLVAISDKQKREKILQQELLIKPIESKNSLIRATAQYLNTEFGDLSQIDQTQQLNFKIEGKRQFVQLLDYRNQLGLDWLVVVLIPEADFLARIQANTYRTIILCVLALAIATVIGIYLSYRITNPISELSHAARKIQEKKFQHQVNVKGIYELEVLANSFNQMSQEIAEYSQSLEQKVSDRTAALEQANQELMRLSAIDGLTSIANRRSFDQYLSQEWKRMAREQKPLSLILFDVDYFKLYNDEYGHQAGDGCLQQIAKTSSDTVNRPADFVARYGGEEFGVILPNTDLEGTVIVAEKIRSAVKNLQLNHQKSSVSKYISVSLGVASIIPTFKLNPEHLIAQADKALYAAKEQGRDRVACNAAT